MQLPELNNFYLVGGTALSLYYGHRLSVDIDCFQQYFLQMRKLFRYWKKISKILIQNGHLSRFTYSNTVALGLSVDELSWVKDFIENYQQFWQIEKAIRIAKTDLKIRPIYHRLQRRIEAHICLFFAADKRYKELERQLNEKKANISPMSAIEIVENIFEVAIKLPNNGKIKKKNTPLNRRAKVTKFRFSFWVLKCGSQGGRNRSQHKPPF